MQGNVLILSILLSVLTDGAYALIVGTLLAGRWLAEPESAPAIPAQQALSPQAKRRMLLLCIAVLTLSHLVRPWFLAASMSGSTGLRENIALIPTILSSTHQGTLWYINSAAIGALWIATLASRVNSSIAGWSSLACILLIAFAKAATGHAADQGDFTLVEILQAFHLLATAVWSGAILVSGLLIVPRLARQRGPAAVWNYTARLSKSATWALSAVLATGIYTSDRELNNTLAGLWSSTWGKILIAKVAFVLLALCLGSISRFRYLSAEATPTRSTHLVRLLASEAVAMIVILSLSGLLGNNAPPMSAM